MTIRVGINGFGRIGRNVFRIAQSRDDIEIVHINDLTSDAMLAHLLAHDSVHGRFGGEVKAVDGGLMVNGALITTSAEPNPAALPWGEKAVDVVLECTGRFTTREKAAAHLSAGAKKVIISAPGTGVDATIVVGVNDGDLDASAEVVSNASCTTNCLAPAAKVLDDSFGIEHGLMTTVHAYTMDQNLLDAPHKKDFRRARAAALNMVPTTTGAAKAVGLVLPQLKGKLNGMAIRVPTPNVSLVDLTVRLREPATKESINAAFVEAANGPLKGILGAMDAPLVSSDLVGNTNSSTVDLALTDVMDGHTAKIITWYDNEWGFSARMLDLCALLMGGKR